MIPLPPRPTWEGAAIFTMVVVFSLSVFGVLFLAFIGALHLLGYHP